MPDKNQPPKQQFYPIGQGPQPTPQKGAQNIGNSSYSPQQPAPQVQPGQYPQYPQQAPGSGQYPPGYPYQQPQQIVVKSGGSSCGMIAIIVLVVLFVIGGIIFAIIAAGVGSVATSINDIEKAKVAPPKFTTGQNISVKNWDLVVDQPSNAGKKLGSSAFDEPATGTYLVVPITIKNTAKQNFGIGSYDFELRDSGGSVYRTSSNVSAFTYSSSHGGGNVNQVPPGSSVKYFLVFDINPSANGLSLTFNQDTYPKVSLGI